MVELRWVKEKSPYDPENTPARWEPRMVLQYRQRGDSPLPEGCEWNWTDWADVPMAEDE